MNPHDESRLAEHRHAFLRLLPRRVETIGRRLHRFLQEGWDINGLALMHDDARFLGDACGRHGLEDASRHFGQMQALLGETLVQQALPGFPDSEPVEPDGSDGASNGRLQAERPNGDARLTTEQYR